MLLRVVAERTRAANIQKHQVARWQRCRPAAEEATALTANIWKPAREGRFGGAAAAMKSDRELYLHISVIHPRQTFPPSSRSCHAAPPPHPPTTPPGYVSCHPVTMKPPRR